MVYTLGDIRRLLIDGADDGAGLGIESHAGVGVTDPVDRGAHDFGNVDVCLGGDFAGDAGEPGSDERFAGDSSHGIVVQNGVESGVRDRVRDLVRMTFGYGLGRQQMSIEHEVPLGNVRMIGGNGRTPYYSCA